MVDNNQKLEEFLNRVELPIEPTGNIKDRLMTVAELPNVCVILQSLYGSYNMAEMQTEWQNTRVLKITSKGKEEQSFYVKIGWEGAVREALAMELYGLVTGRKIPYALCGDLVITGEVKGKDLKVSPRLSDNTGYAYQYGKLEECSRAIGLDDRATKNIKVTKKGLENIDFGQSFQHDSSKDLHELNFDRGEKLPVPEHRMHGCAGAEKEKMAIKKNIEKNLPKIKGILDSIDDDAYERIKKGFCLSGNRIHNPREILYTYVSRNGWQDLAKELSGYRSNEDLFDIDVFFEE